MRSVRGAMPIVRWSKAFLVALIGVFGVLVSLNNIFNYQSNFYFVQHVMLMDTTHLDNKLMWRSISSPAAHHLVLWLIITGEMLTGLLCFFGAWKLLSAANRPSNQFRKAKQLAITGLCLGIFVWFFGFLTVAAEWFLMWQSQEWNGVQAAFRFVVCIGIVLLYLNQNDPDPISE